MNFPPPARRRGKVPQHQEFAPVNVVLALIGQSKRRCVTYGEMMEKQSAGLIQLQMECQQMAGLIRHDPQGLNRLAISLHAARSALEKNKLHLEEQIQVELFLQGEFQRWLNGEPPTEFAPPPPGMTRRQIPPSMMQPLMQPRELPMTAQAQQDPDLDYGQYPSREQPPHYAPSQPPRLRPKDGPPPMLPSAGALAAYSTRQGQAPSQPQQQQPQQPPQQTQQLYPQQPQRMPVVRLPVEQFGRSEEHTPAPRAPAAAAPVNGPSSAPAIAAPDDEDDPKNTTSSTPS